MLRDFQKTHFHLVFIRLLPSPGLCNPHREGLEPLSEPRAASEAFPWPSLESELSIESIVKADNLGTLKLKTGPR